MATYIPHVNKLKENLVTDLSQWNEEEDTSNIVLTFGPTGPCPGPLQTLPSSQGVLCYCTSPSGQHSGIGSPRILFLSNPEPTSRLVWILFCILFSQLLLPSSSSLDPRDPGLGREGGGQEASTGSPALPTNVRGRPECQEIE